MNEIWLEIPAISEQDQKFEYKSLVSGQINTKISLYTGI